MPLPESDFKTLTSIWALLFVALAGGSLLRWTLTKVPTAFFLTSMEKLVTVAVIMRGAIIGGASKFSLAYLFNPKSATLEA